MLHKNPGGITSRSSERKHDLEPPNSLGQVTHLNPPLPGSLFVMTPNPCSPNARSTCQLNNARNFLCTVYSVQYNCLIFFSPFNTLSVVLKQMAKPSDDRRDVSLPPLSRSPCAKDCWNKSATHPTVSRVAVFHLLFHSVLWNRILSTCIYNQILGC